MNLRGHSQLNNARNSILVDFVYLEEIFITVEVDRKITNMRGHELVGVIYNSGI